MENTYAFKSIFCKEALEKLGRLVKFLIRASVIHPFIFVYAFSFKMFGNVFSLDSLAAHLCTKFKISITGQALSKRLNSSAAVKLMKAQFKKTLEFQLKSCCNNKYAELFPMFKGILLEDSSPITLCKKIKGLHRSGRSGEKSAIKLNWVTNLFNLSATAVDIFNGNENDQGNSLFSIKKYLKPGYLMIRDLGYLSYEALNQIEKTKAFFLSRINYTYKFYLKNDSEEAIDLKSMISKSLSNKSRLIRKKVFLGKNKQEMWIIIEKVPNRVKNQRLKKQKRNGKVSEDFQFFAGYTMFVTNIKDELFKASDEQSIMQLIISLYRIRWQIELTFKNLKSNGKVDRIDYKTKNRVLCLIYGRLTHALLISSITSKIFSDYTREISCLKLTDWLVKESLIVEAFLSGNYINIFTEIKRGIKFFFKDIRSRKTSLEELEDFEEIVLNNKSYELIFDDSQSNIDLAANF